MSATNGPRVRIDTWARDGRRATGGVAGTRDAAAFEGGSLGDGDSSASNPASALRDLGDDCGSMAAAYESDGSRWWQHVSDAQVATLAVLTVVGAWWGRSPWLLVLALVAGGTALVRRRPDLAVVAVVVIVAAGLLGERAWTEAAPRRLGPFTGWATIVSDPVTFGRGVRVVLDIEGQRFEAISYGSPRRRLQQRQAGDRVLVEGERVMSRGPWARRAQVRHVVGGFELDRVSAHRPGTPLALASNRVRDRLRRVAERSMTSDHAALFTGLVIGDDTRQPRAMIEQFRSAGLSHLTAVSGQNVAFVLAVAGVGLRRLSRWWRLAATWALIGWFVVLTRIEPSVVRAGVMAGLSATAFAIGKERSPARLLALAVIALVLIDPLLVWSVAFWLSVGATAGVCVVAPWLEPRLHGPRWVVAPLSVTLGAQLGVVVPSWLVFHRMPVMGIGANLLAVPVAGFVMLYGIPAGLVASMLPDAVAQVVMLPASVGTTWVATVARLAARLEPSGSVAVMGWVVQLCGVVGAGRWVGRWAGRWVGRAPTRDDG